MNFEERFDEFLKEQKKGASGQRLEMLNRGLKGTKLLLKSVIFPVFKTFDGLCLEYDMMSLSGYRIYSDVLHCHLGISFEEENYVTHGEKVTRDRFSAERMKARSVGTRGLIYFPYSTDELEKNPEFCRRNLFELVGSLANLDGLGLLDLPVFEREVLRWAIIRYEPFELSHVCAWLQLNPKTCSKIVRSLLEKDFLEPIGGGKQRSHKFIISPAGISLFHRHYYDGRIN